MKQVVVFLLLFCCAQAQRVQYRVEYVLIADTCCGNADVRWLDSVGVEYRKAGSAEAWKSLQNLGNIES